MPRFHNINGERVQFTAAEETARDAEEQAWADGANDRAAEQVREERDIKLSETDWMASSDLTMSSEWVSYRSSLRDVPSQAGFPNSVTWPVEPS
jgi:hypothetical protein|tara:strand:- start:22 stop:303 length:282 start_codon:yes stop_codon:yes gene_type:complete